MQVVVRGVASDNLQLCKILACRGPLEVHVGAIWIHYASCAHDILLVFFTAHGDLFLVAKYDRHIARWKWHRGEQFGVLE